MKTSIIVAIIVLLAVPVWAVTYMWEDNQGTVSFTEDLGSIPQKYRKKAKILGEEEDAPSATIQMKEEPKPGQKDRGKGETIEQAAPAEKKKTYGSKSGDTWRREFAQTRGDIKAAEDQLDELNGRIKDTSKMSRSEYLSIQMGVNSVENRLQRLRGKRDALTEEANRAGVPAEFRGE
ncbi:MAG TPA: DUF4124 domain-containing protein [Geobacteraceae bacterium]|nr:DUF4124 domain-containing protein [Geobacteraceae bacterium]